MGDRLATTDKQGGCCDPFWGQLGPHLTYCGLGQRSTSVPSGNLIHPAVWPQQTWAKSWGRAVLDGLPSNTMWPGPRPTSMPNFILIHPTVWSQYNNVTGRQTDRQTGQRSDNIRRTVSQTVGQKLKTHF